MRLLRVPCWFAFVVTSLLFVSVRFVLCVVTVYVKVTCRHLCSIMEQLPGNHYSSFLPESNISIKRLNVYTLHQTLRKTWTVFSQLPKWDVFNSFLPRALVPHPSLLSPSERRNFLPSLFPTQISSFPSASLQQPSLHPSLHSLILILSSLLTYIPPTRFCHLLSSLLFSPCFPAHLPHLPSTTSVQSAS